MAFFDLVRAVILARAQRDSRLMGSANSMQRKIFIFHEMRKINRLRCRSSHSISTHCLVNEHTNTGNQRPVALANRKLQDDCVSSCFYSCEIFTTIASIIRRNRRNRVHIVSLCAAAGAITAIVRMEPDSRHIASGVRHTNRPRARPDGLYLWFYFRGHYNNEIDKRCLAEIIRKTEFICSVMATVGWWLLCSVEFFAFFSIEYVLRLSTNTISIGKNCTTVYSITFGRSPRRIDSIPLYCFAAALMQEVAAEPPATISTNI